MNKSFEDNKQKEEEELKIKVKKGNYVEPLYI